MKLARLLPILLAFFIISCVAATPRINLRSSSGISMELEKAAYRIVSTAFLPDGKYALSGSVDGVLKIWEVPTGREIRTITVKGGVQSASFSPDGRHVLSGSMNGALRLWEIKTGMDVRQFIGHSGASGGVSSVAFSPDGHSILSGGFDKALFLWDAATGKVSIVGLGEYSKKMTMNLSKQIGHEVLYQKLDALQDLVLEWHMLSARCS